MVETHALLMKALEPNDDADQVINWDFAHREFLEVTTGRAITSTTIKSPVPPPKPPRRRRLSDSKSSSSPSSTSAPGSSSSSGQGPLLYTEAAEHMERMIQRSRLIAGKYRSCSLFLCRC